MIIRGIYISVDVQSEIFEVSFNSVKVKNFITDWIDIKYFVVFIDITNTFKPVRGALSTLTRAPEVLDLNALFFGL